MKAKEEADDLAQEMAELRYQMTSLLEEECKRRACIEHASLQRIAELEAQVNNVRICSPLDAQEDQLNYENGFLVFVMKIQKEQRPFCGITKFHEA